MITNSDLDLIPRDLFDALAPTDPAAATAPATVPACAAPGPDDDGDDRDGSPRDAV